MLFYPSKREFFSQALVNVEAVELVVQAPITFSYELIERYNVSVVFVAPRLPEFSLKSVIECLAGDEMRLRIIVTKRGDS